MAQNKYYVVWAGHKPGIYTSWADCQKQVNKFPQAKFKSYSSQAEAEKAFKEGAGAHWGQGGAKSGSGSAGSFRRPAAVTLEEAGEIDYDSISVDVGTRGNPGPVEYKGVDTRTGEVLFAYGPVSKGTNNLGEFLAIVHALEYLKERGSSKTVYSDSVNAMKWVKQKAVATTLPRDESTREIWFLIDKAEQWLRTHTYPNKILKWQTHLWGEIKADYGRK
ncbi:ribonuclease H [Paenibacillus tarimensis]|uniref:ribonuclease H n=1 Tax=Paenibacillus tarimensis TaxID=416012 RepID=UPI001F2C435C|nr:ribonuclease H family protein [Paenibacillus tarimensis]MCF2945717.1 ribonuclease H family protein [Paenibacillus tarimensis]